MLPLIFFIILASVVGTEFNNIHLDGSYKLVETILMHDTSKEPVGYKITGELNIYAIQSTLFFLQLISPKLHIMSRKSPVPHGFIEHSSFLDSAYNNPFLIELEKGNVRMLHLSANEETFMKNLKKGISSLFQFQIESAKIQELDVSGMCNISYLKQDNEIWKTKTNCQPPIANHFTDSLWGGKLNSEHQTTISLSENGKNLKSISAKETHTLKSNMADFSIIKVASEIELTFNRKLNENKITDGDKKDIIKQFQSEFGIDYKECSLFPERDITTLNKGSSLNLESIVKENKQNLLKKEIGTSKSALTMIRVLQSLQLASASEIYKILENKENKNILPQLMDILGAAQTSQAHQAALKKLRINKKDFDLDLSERYFWSLSMSSKPKLSIIKDMMKVIDNKHENPKFFETLLFTLAAMARNYNEMIRQMNTTGDEELINEVSRSIVDKLEDCDEKDDNCKEIYLKALSNTASPTSLETLLKLAVSPLKKSSVMAIHAIRKLGLKNWNNKVITMAERVFMSSEFDSSARTIALDIILESNPSELLLTRISTLLKNKRAPKEIKEYLLQCLTQFSEDEREFKEKLIKVFKSENLFNYDALAPGGFSTAFTRSFMERGTLSTTQEVSKGILKRGKVNINLSHNNKSETIFTLGIFSSGLGSFMASSDSNDEESIQEKEQDEEDTTAGLELTVLGVGLRRFVFFQGQGELMGHVWSGTASTKTPAYQALLLMNKETATVALGNGFLADISILASSSVDLSGQVQVSIWNRNAQSLVQNSAGLALEGVIDVDSSLVKTSVDFNILAEPRLDLTSDIDFSDSLALCLQLKQPDSKIRYNTYKVERIPESRHRLRKARYKSIHIPGRTYALNPKNNENCNIIYKNK